MMARLLLMVRRWKRWAFLRLLFALLRRWMAGMVISFWMTGRPLSVGPPWLFLNLVIYLFETAYYGQLGIAVHSFWSLHFLQLQHPLRLGRLHR